LDFIIDTETDNIIDLETKIVSSKNDSNIEQKSIKYKEKDNIFDTDKILEFKYSKKQENKGKISYSFYIY
jgi:hypothetical protein